MREVFTHVIPFKAGRQKIISSGCVRLLKAFVLKDQGLLRLTLERNLAAKDFTSSEFTLFICGDKTIFRRDFKFIDTIDFEGKIFHLYASLELN